MFFLFEMSCKLFLVYVLLKLEFNIMKFVKNLRILIKWFVWKIVNVWSECNVCENFLVMFYVLFFKGMMEYLFKYMFYMINKNCIMLVLI